MKILTSCLFILAVSSSHAIQADELGKPSPDASSRKSTLPGGAVDPYEPLNRMSWDLNYNYLDRYALRPMVHAYVDWVPTPIRNGIGNVTENLNEANYFVNNLLVGRVADSGTSVLRFALNSTVGLLGMVDVASDMGIQRKSMSMSTVLGKATVDQGAYFMVPLYGPTTMRSAIGDTVDGLYFPYVNMNLWTRVAIWATDSFSKRARVVDQEAVLDNALDPYVTAKDFYLQYEESKVLDGQAPKPQPASDAEDNDAEVDRYLDEID